MKFKQHKSLKKLCTNFAKGERQSESLKNAFTVSPFPMYNGH